MVGVIRDVTGERFGRWTVLSMFDYHTPKQVKRMCRCRCDCGVERNVYYHNLMTGMSKGCGYCYTNGYRIDLSGQTFGLFTVVDFDTKTKKWNCKCSCGRICQKSGGSLTYKSKELKFCGDNTRHADDPVFQSIPTKAMDYTGEVCSNLTVLSRLPDKQSPSGRRHNRWLCKCNICGYEMKVYGFDLSYLKKHEYVRCANCHSNKRKERLSKEYVTAAMRMVDIKTKKFIEFFEKSGLSEEYRYIVRDKNLFWEKIRIDMESGVLSKQQFLSNEACRNRMLEDKKSTFIHHIQVGKNVGTRKYVVDRLPYSDLDSNTFWKNVKHDIETGVLTKDQFLADPDNVQRMIADRKRYVVFKTKVLV